MPKIRLFVNSDLNINTALQLDEKQAHYLHNVMRQKIGVQLKIFNGREGEWLAEISSINKKSATLTILEKLKDQKNENELTLFFAPTKNVATSYIIQKATELGVTKICPVLTKRTIVNKVNVEKLEAVAIEAAEQCERLTVPEVYGIKDLKQVIAEKDFSGKLILCDERGEAQSLIDSFSNLDDGNAILIGPEGGFDEDEFMFLKNQDFILPITLGDRILRADTAVVAALSVYQTLCGDWK